MVAIITFSWDEKLGIKNTTGGNNVFIGDYRTGYDNTTGSYNLFLGSQPGLNNTTGSYNIYMGRQTGRDIEDGTYNVMLGYQAGMLATTGSKNVFIGYQAGKNESTSDKLYIDNSAVAYPLIYGDFENDILEFNGSVGIGTTPINGKFEVNGSIDTVINNYSYLNNANSTTSYVSSNTTDKAISIYASDRIVGKYVISMSDERIKDIKGLSDNKTDLDILTQIEITDYEFKDKVKEGDTKQKKVIAQQVAKVYPQAVNKQFTEVVPDIYQTATIDENGWVSFNGQLTMDNVQLQIGEKVQIIFKNKKEVLEILETKGNTFRVQPSSEASVNCQPSTVFIYGRQVTDFHTVDYEAISMLNVSATQQLAKENSSLKEQVQQQQVEINDLKHQLERINQLEAKLETLLNNQ